MKKLICHLGLGLLFALLAGAAAAQTLINVRVAGGSPGIPTGTAAFGYAGTDVWNYFPNLGGRASGGGVVTNATTFRDSGSNLLAGVSMQMSLSGGDGFDSFTDNNAFSPTPVLLMGHYVYENAGVNYFTFVFSGLATNRTYFLYGLGNGNQSGQGSTWWIDTANGHATASATANYALGDRNVTLASNQNISWVKVPATTTAAGALTFRVVQLNGNESGTGGSGRAYLNGFQLLLLTPPAIAGLTNQTVVAGTTALLAPTVTGTPAPTYQWRSNGTNIVGATNATLSLPNVQFIQNGFTYSLVASNYVGKVTNTMTLSVIFTPAISGLTNQAVSIGTDVTLSGTATGVPAPALQWRRSGTNLVGATGSSYVILNAQAADSGTYSLVASNSAGVVTNSMTLTVSASDLPPSIVGPANQTVIQTSNATFSASVSGLPLPSLQWRVNGTDIPGATDISLIVSNVAYAQNGFVYSLVASNTAGMVTNSATLSVLVPAAITQHPTNLTVVTGSSASFSVVAGGVPTVRYQWMKNGSPIANATNAVYSPASVTGADNDAVFSVLVTNSVNSLTSSNAELTVLSTMTGALLPTNNAAGIAPDQQLRMVFSATPKIGGGRLYLRDASNNSLLETIDTDLFQTITLFGATVTNNFTRTVQGSVYFYQPIALYGNEAWITFSNRLAYNKTYYVTLEAGLFRDAANASYPAISTTNTWRFSTKTSGPATPTTSTGLTNLTIGLDGAGDFATFQGAADWVPQNNTLKRTFNVLPGIYRDYLCLRQSRNNIAFIGTGASRTDAQLIYLYPSGSGAATMSITTSDIYVRNLTVDNKVYLTNNGVVFAGPINTVFTAGNRIVFDNVLMKGGQDTLYANSGTAYYYRSEIWGSVDFIYGDQLAVFDQCDIIEIRNTGGPITAPSTPYAQPYGEVFLNCNFPRALIANGYPYDVGTATTTFQRPWRQDGQTAIINCSLGSQFTTKGWAEWDGRETTCRAREVGSTQIGGGTVTPAQRQAAGAYWLNTADPDYTSSSMNPTNALLFPPTGHLNRTNVTVNTNDYTLDAMFGHSYFGLGSWRPTTLPTITTQPTNKTASAGSATSFTVAAFGQPTPTYQWRKNGTNVVGQTNATLSFSSAKLADNGTYSVVVSNSAGTLTSSNAVLTIPALPTSITPTFTNGAMSLFWPASQTGFRLLAQTNPPGVGLTTNWQPYGNSNSTNQVSVPTGSTNGSVFFRLVYP
ncbi:MAG: pectinesterase family protein [Verrucomicrobiota bacterium]